MEIFCGKCNLRKEESLFYKCEYTKTRRQTKCINCEKEYRKKNKEKISEYHSIYNKTHKLENKIQKQKYKEKIGKEAFYQQKRKWAQNNKNWFNAYQREWRKAKKESDPSFLIGDRLRKQISGYIKKGFAKKIVNTENLLGCSWEELKIHIELQFTKNMSWEKYHKNLISIDHIKPCCSFDLSDLSQQKECFHFTNLRPLWKTTKIAIEHGEPETYIGNLNKIGLDMEMSLRPNYKNGGK